MHTMSFLVKNEMKSNVPDSFGKEETLDPQETLQQSQTKNNDQLALRRKDNTPSSLPQTMERSPFPGTQRNEKKHTHTHATKRET